MVGPLTCRDCQREATFLVEGRCLACGTAICKYCLGSGTYVGGDELHVCWCRREESA